MRDNEGNISKWTCFQCDGTPPPKSIVLDSERCQTVCGAAVVTFAKLIKLSAFAEARQPRVLAMVALKKYAIHFNNAEFMDLKSSPLGQWCVVSLKSSSRELRISAG
jgi:serine/threonine-protein kinase ATR